MCDTCGCSVNESNKHLLKNDGKLAQTSEGKQAVEVLTSLLHENDHQASHNRAHFDKHQALAINLMSSPGSGKTALLEKTIEALKDKYRIAVIEGDLETENDAERIRAKGVTAIQIATGTACHLDAHMVHDALHQLDLSQYDIVFIENVGNLVCPANFDIGHHRNVTLLSVTEGDDKPAKYPVMFRASDLMVISKSELLDFLDDFSPENAEHHLRHLASSAPVISLSSKTGDNLDGWFNWLEQQLTEYRALLDKGQTLLPTIEPNGIAVHLAPQYQSDQSAEHHHGHHHHHDHEHDHDHTHHHHD